MTAAVPDHLRHIIESYDDGQLTVEPVQINTRQYLEIAFVGEGSNYNVQLVPGLLCRLVDAGLLRICINLSRFHCYEFFFHNVFVNLGAVLESLEGNLVVGALTEGCSEFARLWGFSQYINLPQEPERASLRDLPFFKRDPAFEQLRVDRARGQDILRKWKEEYQKILNCRPDPWNAQPEVKKSDQQTASRVAGAKSSPRRDTPRRPGPDVQVFGEEELVSRLEAGGRVLSHCISIRNPNQQMPKVIRDSFEQVLELRFRDVEDATHLLPQQANEIVTLEHIRQVITFFNATKDRATGYTVHCWHGQSRSTAVALGLLYMITGSEEEAGQILARVRRDPLPVPLQRIVRYFDELLGCSLTPIAFELRNKWFDKEKRELKAMEASILAPQQREGSTYPRFPRALTCPACARKLKVEKPGRFRCPNCNSILVVDKTGDVAVGQQGEGWQT